MIQSATNTIKLGDLAYHYPYAQCFIPSFQGWSSTLSTLPIASLVAVFPELEVTIHEEQKIDGVDHLHGSLYHPSADGFFVILAQSKGGK